MSIKLIKTLTSLCLLPLLLTACEQTAHNADEQQETATTQKLESTATAKAETQAPVLSPEKTIATTAHNAIFKHYNEALVREHFNADYIQHNPYINTGIEPIIRFLPRLKMKGTTAKVHRIIQDNDIVAMHVSYDNAEDFGAKQVVAFDIWRIENGKIAEHWDVINPLMPQTASGRTQLSGPTQITDLDKTEANKTLVKNFMNYVLMGAAPEKITEYISTEQYHQHNLGIKDGLAGLNEALATLQAENNMFMYKKVHRIIGEGNFVLTQSEGFWNQKDQAFYDLFRIEGGKIVEHWDIIQPIPPRMPHNNGMF